VSIIWFTQKRVQLNLIERDINHGPTKENQGSRERRNDSRIATLLHDGVNDWYSEAAEDGGEGPHSYIGNVIRSIAIPNIFELEVSIKAYKPARESKK